MVDPRGIGEGDKYDQNTLHGILIKQSYTRKRGVKTPFSHLLSIKSQNSDSSYGVRDDKTEGIVGEAAVIPALKKTILLIFL